MMMVATENKQLSHNKYGEGKRNDARETSRWSTRVKNYDSRETIAYSGDVRSRQAIRLPMWRFVAFK